MNKLSRTLIIAALSALSTASYAQLLKQKLQSRRDISSLILMGTPATAMVRLICGAKARLDTQLF